MARDVRKRLIAATAELIEERGPLEVRVEQIAARAGCSRATLYRYVADKDELVREVIMARTAAMADIVGRQVAGISDPADRVAQALLLFSDAMRSERWFVAFDEHNSGNNTNAIIRMGGGLEALITMLTPFMEKTLTDLDNAGHLRDGVDVRDATEWLIGVELSLLDPFADHSREHRLAMLTRYAVFPLIKSD